MEHIISTLFSEYLSGQTVSGDPGYSRLSGQALTKEKEFRGMLTREQTVCFEQLFELTAQIHFLEVKDAFFSACKLGANAAKEFTI